MPKIEIPASVPAPKSAPTKIDIDVSNDYGTNTEVSYNSGNCPISSNSGKVNLRIGCDENDCDNDSSTIVSYAVNGENASLLQTPPVPSSQGFEWVEIETSKGQYWIASSKLSCYQGE